MKKEQKTYSLSRAARRVSMDDVCWMNGLFGCSAVGWTLGWMRTAVVSVGIAAILATLCLPTPAVAADWRLTPRVGLYGGYDDNIFFGGSNEVSSTVINVEPGVELDYETLLSSLSVRADFDILRYLEESDLDRVNQYYRLQGNHRLGQRWNARGGLRYYQDSTQNTYLEELGRVIAISDRDYFYAMGGLAYEMTNVDWVDGEIRYENAFYESDRYSDYDRQRASLRYRHRLKTQQDVISVGPSYYHRSNDSNDTDYASLDVGWERDWSDITNTFASVGARYANVQKNDGDDQDDWGVRARLELTRLGVASTIRFRYYHDLDTTAAGTDVNVDNFSLDYNRRLTERFGVGVDGRLVFSYSLSGSSNDVDDSRYYRIQPYLFYRLTQNLRASLRYSYQNSSQDLVDSKDSRDRNRVWIQFNYELPMML